MRELTTGIKVAWVVGGSSGIGLAAARMLVRRGARVAIFARDAEGLERARRALARTAGDERACLALTMDATDCEQTRRALDRVAQETGAPDLVLMAAGEARPAPVEQIDAAQFAAILAANLTAAYHVCRAALPWMVPGSRLALISSLAGLLGVYGYADYSAAKFGVVGLAQVLRQEMDQRGIGVSVLCPPDTDTPGYHRENLSKPPQTRALSADAGLLSAERVAGDLLAGVERGRFLIVPGLKAKLIVAAQRFCPGLVWRVMRRQLRQGADTGGPAA